MGVINYSALARSICDYYEIDRFEAVLIACRRYVDRLQHIPREEKIVELLSQTKLRVRNKITVAILDKPRDFGKIYAFQKYVRKDKADFNLIEVSMQ